MFKVNNKMLTYFTPCSSVSIVNFELVNTGGDVTPKFLFRERTLSLQEGLKFGT